MVLPGQLRDLARGRARVDLETDPATVADALGALRARLPAVYERLVTEQGNLRAHVNLFVGAEDIRWSGGLDTPVPAGAEIVVIPSVSGG